MASPSSIAESISQVSRESVYVRLRGCVQTVFPMHACMPPTANNETQDYGTVGSDGPIEGATKVFQVTLRDLSVSNGGLHRINAYFYDKWADDYSGVSLGDELTVSGPAASLVHPDPSADAGDHPFCLVFYTEGGGGEGGDAMLSPSGASTARLAGGSGADEVGDGVACSVVTPVERAVRKGPASRRGQAQGAAGSGRGQGGARGGSEGAKEKYTYTSLASLRAPAAQAHVYGVVCSFSHRHQSKGRDVTTSVSLLDETCTQSDNAVPCNFFHSSMRKLPAPVMVGDIVRIHRAKVQQYRGRPQLVGVHDCVSWLVVRKKKIMQETFQKGLPIGGGGGGGGGGSGSVGDDDVDPFEDSPPSGPDAGGGEADSVLPAAVWEVQASTARYTMLQEDHDRCNALDAWFKNNAPRLLLKQPSEPEIWVKDIFRRPRQGEVATESEVDLICCLASKHEEPGGGAGSLLNVYVADGTGFAVTRTPSAVLGQRDAALQKGMRAALGNPDWSPVNPSPSPFPAYLKIEVVENKKEWESLNLSPGMWIRLRRLTIMKNRDTCRMLAKMKEGTSSVNPLHPSMAEVQTIAISYARRCASADDDSPTPPPGVGNDSAQDPRRANDDTPTPGPAPGLASSASTREGVTDIGGRGREGPQDSGLDKGGVSSAPPERGRREASSRPPVEERTLQHEQATHSPGARAESQPGRKEAGGQRTSGGTAVAAAEGVVSGCPASGGGGGSGDASRRGTKRALPAADVEGVVAPVSYGPLSDLGMVRHKPPPEAFDIRVRIIDHFPSNVIDFVRQGPGPGDGLRFLFILRLEDDGGVVDAVATGLDASHLLPGSPSPEQFYRSEDVRGRVQRALERLESEGGGMWRLRLRSYLTPMESGGRGGGSDFRSPVCCKRYSIVAPSSLEEGMREGNAWVVDR